MQYTKTHLSPQESIQNAIGLLLRDFRQYCSPSGQPSIEEWKRRKIKSAIVVSKSNMRDKTEEMLASIAQRENAKIAGDTSNSGDSLYLPIMVAALSVIEVPPFDDIFANEEWHKVIVPTDPLQRVVQMRTRAVCYRVQIAFFCSNTHEASTLSNQFMAFWRNEQKRVFPVIYEVGVHLDKPITTTFEWRVLQNSLTPNAVDVGIPTVEGAIIDFECVGLEPNIVGLGGFGDDITDKGEPDGSVDDGTIPIGGGTTTPEQLNKVVLEADLYDIAADTQTRVKVDPLTNIITETEIKDK